MEITKDINLHTLIGKYPQTAQFLYQEYGLHCVQCIANKFDTLEAGMRLHGYDDEHILEAEKALQNFIAINYE